MSNIARRTLTCSEDEILKLLDLPDSIEINSVEMRNDGQINIEIISPEPVAHFGNKLTLQTDRGSMTKNISVSSLLNQEKIETKNEIQLHPLSREYLDGLFDKVEEVESLPEIMNGRVIVHLYPTRDTYSSSGELEGYRDSLFFEAHVYYYPTSSKSLKEDTIGIKKVYKQKDGVKVELPAQHNIFKDGSSMIAVYGENIMILSGQSLTIVENEKSYSN